MSEHERANHRQGGYLAAKRRSLIGGPEAGQ
jgi:hypothetical protein